MDLDEYIVSAQKHLATLKEFQAEWDKTWMLVLVQDGDERLPVWVKRKDFKILEPRLKERKSRILFTNTPDTGCDR